MTIHLSTLRALARKSCEMPVVTAWRNLAGRYCIDVTDGVSVISVNDDEPDMAHAMAAAALAARATKDPR